jgi:hypothetical protein
MYAKLVLALSLLSVPTYGGLLPQQQEFGMSLDFKDPVNHQSDVPQATQLASWFEKGLHEKRQQQVVRRNPKFAVSSGPRNVCIMDITDIAAAGGAFWHFMNGHLQHNAGLLASNKILPTKRSDALTRLSFSTKAFSWWWLWYTEVGIATETRHDPECKATKSEGGLILTQIYHGIVPVLRNGTTTSEDWTQFMEVCAATPIAFNALASELGAQDVKDTTNKGLVLTADRTKTRRALNWKEAEAQFGAFAQEQELAHRKVEVMGDLTRIEAVKLMARTRVYAFYHGSDSCYESFMPRDGTVIEFMPHDAWHCTFPYCAASLEDRAFTWILSTTWNAGFAGLNETRPFADPSLHTYAKFLPSKDTLWSSNRDTSRKVDVGRVLEALRFAFKAKTSNGRVHAGLMQWNEAAQKESKSSIACSGTALQIFEA